MACVCCSLCIFVLSTRSFHVSPTLYREVPEANARGKVSYLPGESLTSGKMSTCMPICRNRKTGFDCPRGKGKGSVYMTPCNGKASQDCLHSFLYLLRQCKHLKQKVVFSVQIQKSHPVHIRNDDCANRRKVRPLVDMRVCAKSDRHRKFQM